jgi:hypothetical protein
MEERQHGDADLVLAHVQHGLTLAEVGDQVVVAEHDPLGQAGRAAGIRQDREVSVRVDPHLGGLAAAAQQGRERGGPLRLAEHEDLPDT